MKRSPRWALALELGVRLRLSAVGESTEVVVFLRVGVPASESKHDSKEMFDEVILVNERVAFDLRSGGRHARTKVSDREGAREMVCREDAASDGRRMAEHGMKAAGAGGVGSWVV